LRDRFSVETARRSRLSNRQNEFDRLLDTNNFAGQIIVEDIPKTIKFTATPQTKAKGHK